MGSLQTGWGIWVNKWMGGGSGHQGDGHEGCGECEVNGTCGDWRVKGMLQLEG